MEYVKTRLQQAITIDAVVSVHYYEYPIDFAFSGEVHDFWELVYVDKGKAVITAGSRELPLPAGHLYLHKPMEYHNIRCGEGNAVNSFIVSFCSEQAALYAAAGKPIACDDRQRTRMAQIVVEARQAFSTPLGKVIAPQLERREDAGFGCEQMMQTYLEQLLIDLVRTEQRTHPAEDTDAPSLGQRRSDTLLQSVCAYLEEHVADSVTIEDLCRRFCVSKSTLQKLFRSRVGSGISHVYQQLKVDRAKAMIREKQYNFTEIAQRLGYSSVHYFSRHFKQVAGMTPSEYAASVMALCEEA